MEANLEMWWIRLRCESKLEDVVAKLEMSDYKLKMWYSLLAKLETW